MGRNGSKSKAAAIREQEEAFRALREFWNESCPGLDEILHDLAKELHGEVEAWINDTPSRVLSWKTDDQTDREIEYTISMVLEPPNDDRRRPTAPTSLKLWGVAWRDLHEDSEHATRRLLRVQEETWGVPVNTKEASWHLQRWRADVQERAALLFRDGPVDGVQEVGLPPRPGLRSIAEAEERESAFA